MFSHYAPACFNLSESHQFWWIYFNGLKIPLLIFWNVFFFWLEQIVRRWMDSLYVIFSQHRSCDTTLGLRSDGSGRIFDRLKNFRAVHTKLANQLEFILTFVKGFTICLCAMRYFSKSQLSSHASVQQRLCRTNIYPVTLFTPCRFNFPPHPSKLWPQVFDYVVPCERNGSTFRFLENCPPTPPLAQHFALSEK